MKPTKIERLILSNQCRILAALYPEEASDYAETGNIFERGYVLHYSEHAQHIEEEVSEEQCREVLNILSMFENLKDSYDALPDKSGIEERQVRFPGFTENEECDLLGYTRFLIETQGRFTVLKQSGHGTYKSCSPKLMQYRRMYAEWQRGDDHALLSKDDIIRIASID